MNTAGQVLTRAIWLATIVVLTGCATQQSVAPGPIGQAQTKLSEARSQQDPPEARIAQYFEAAEVAVREAESRSSDETAQPQAEQIYNDTSAEVTVLLQQADGVFTVLQKKVRHESSIYKGAQMPHMLRLTWTGIAMHPGNLPGYPASAGCVRLPVDFAAKLFSVTGIGTTVIIADNKSAASHTFRPGSGGSGDRLILKALFGKEETGHHPRKHKGRTTGLLLATGRPFPVATSVRQWGAMLDLPIG
jgi:hypothetical protein